MRYVAGFVGAIVLGALVAFVVVWFGLMPAGADAAPFPLEKAAAQHALDATIRREMPQPPYPGGAATDATLAAGAKLYMANCAVCHGSGAGSESLLAKGFYIRAPQLNKHGVADDPEGETYWKIEHGIRFSAMPAFGGRMTEEQIWQIAAFLGRPADQLPPAAKTIWEHAQ